MKALAMKSRAAPASRQTQPAGAFQRTPAVRHILRAPQVQTKLKIGAVDDPAEREADRVADQVMRMPARDFAAGEAAPPPVARPDRASMPSSFVQRKCACGTGNDGSSGRTSVAIQPSSVESVRRLCADCELQRETVGARGLGGGAVAPPADAGLGSLGSSRPLADSERAFFEPRFGRSFDDVRIHAGREADSAAKAINARAFAFGRDIVFSSGEYKPGTTTGRRLLAHELTHVVQSGRASTGETGLERIVRRVAHGPSTPTNCHNWKIPLPPWTAGALAHTQTAFFFASNPGGAGRIVPEVTMPRGTKLLMGLPDPPAITPPGFMDIVGLMPGLIQIGEIKSTASSALATPQAAHYLLRHNEWLSRVPSTDLLDRAYGLVLGGVPGGALMSGLASVTKSGVQVGPFMGDPLKQLWVEADALGAIVYWCKGVGTINPAWALAFRRLYQQIIDAFWEAYEAIMGGIRAVREWIWEHPVIAFIVLVILVVIGLILAVLGGLLELPSFGASTPITLGGLALACSAAVALLGLLGVDTSGLEQGSASITAVTTPPMGSASGADYEREADQGNWGSTTASDQSESMTGGLAMLSEAVSSLPGALTDRALDALNPFSSSKGPSPDAARIAVQNAAGILAKHPDQKIAGIGRYVKEQSGRV